MALELAAKGGDETERLALERAVFIVGEAAARLQPATRDRIDQPWRSIIGLRNVLAHGDEAIRPERLRRIVLEQMPGLLGAL